MLLTTQRLTRMLFATAALALAALSAAWVVTAAREQHVTASRAERAQRLERIVDIAQHERDLVAQNRRAFTTTRSKQIDDLTTALMHLLRTWESGDGAAGLSSKYGVQVLLAGTPSHGKQAITALDGIHSTAAQALTNERVGALRTSPHTGMLTNAEITAAALAAIEGPLLLFWVLRRHRRKVDISHHQQRVDQLSAQARTDALTTLGNRRAFEDDLGLAIANRTETGQGFGLMAIDLDGLKRINDSKGHAAGDVRLRQVADCISEVIRGEGTVYRTGGDEFMVILPGRRNWHGLNLAAKVDQVTRARTGGRAVSIGLAESIETEGRHLLVNQADIALYEAKRTRLSAVAYHPGLSPAVDAHRDDVPSHEQRALAAALARAVDAKDAGTRSHSETVAQLCVAIGQRLEVEPAQLERLRLAGLLHDVGKIGVADAILHKPDALAPEEQSAMTEHVEIGHAILLAAELPIEAHWVLHHHERIDGDGYPSGLSAAAIPIESRIIAVADAFEAMTGTRPYREAVSIEDAIEELQANCDTQFDTQCVNALVEVVNDASTEDQLVGIAHGGRSAMPLIPRREPAAVAAQA